jgi:hypothetical protein
LVVLGCFPNPSSLAGTSPSPKGQRALLEYSIAIEGEFEHRSGHRDEFYKWSTRRLLEAKVEMQATEPRKQSRLFPKDEQTAAAMKGPDQDYRDLAKQMEACPKGDTDCQMQLAMKMMNSNYMQQQNKASQAMEKTPERYQTWQPVQGGKLEAKVKYEDHREEVYYTAGREYHDCRLVAQDPLSDVGRKVLDGMAQAFLVEVDAQTRQQRALIPFTGDLPGQSTCLEGMGSNKANRKKSQQDEYLHFFPKMDVAAGLDGKAPGSDPAVISSGEQTIEGVVPNLSGFTSQREVPVRVTVRWKLTRK